MQTQGLNLFIVDDNQLMVKGLRNYLNIKFGVSLNISTFKTGEDALTKIDEHTNIVILDYYLDGKNGNDILDAIKRINPKTEVIMLSSNESIGIAIESFQKGAVDYVVKDDQAWMKLNTLIYTIITYPIRIMVREFRISKYLALFLLVFAVMGIGVYITMRLTN